MNSENKLENKSTDKSEHKLEDTPAEVSRILEDKSKLLKDPSNVSRILEDESKDQSEVSRILKDKPEDQSEVSHFLEYNPQYQSEVSRILEDKSKDQSEVSRILKDKPEDQSEVSHFLEYNPQYQPEVSRILEDKSKDLPEVFRLEVFIDEDLLEKIKEEKLSLCLARKCEGGTERWPLNFLTWICTDVEAKTTLSWKQGYKVYTSKMAIKAGSEIEVSNSYPLELNQKFHITDREGKGRTDTAPIGIKNGVMIKNHTLNNFTAGLLQTVSVNETLLTIPMFAARVEGGYPLIFTLEDAVYLTLAPSDIKSGTIITKAFGYAGILIDMSGEKTKCVKYTKIKNGDPRIRSITGDFRWETMPEPGKDWGMRVFINQEILPYFNNSF